MIYGIWVEAEKLQLPEKNLRFMQTEIYQFILPYISIYIYFHIYTIYFCHPSEL